MHAEIRYLLKSAEIKTPSSYRCNCESVNRDCCLIGDVVLKDPDIDFSNYSKRIITRDMKVTLISGNIDCNDIDKFLVGLLIKLWNDDNYLYKWCPHRGISVGTFIIKPNNGKDNYSEYTFIKVYFNGLKIDGYEKNKWKEKLELIVDDIIIKLRK
jgi:hypothetical protein